MLRLAGIVPKTLGEYLKQYIDDNHISQNELARRTGVSSGGLSKIMTGGSKHPEPEILAKIADATNISYLELCAMIDVRLAKELKRFVDELTREYPDIDPKIREIAARFERIEQFEPGFTEQLISILQSRISGGGGKT